MTQPVDIVVCGAAGRMGRRIIALAAEDARLRVVGALEARGNAAVGADAGVLAGLSASGVKVGDDLAPLASPGAVIVDFTSAESSLAHLRTAAAKRAPIVIGGAVLTDSKALYDELKFFQNAVGAVPGPQDCYLVLRGLKTLGLRMDRHVASARTIALRLAEDSRVARVYYPGLPDHPQHDLARRQMSGFGAIISFELEGGLDAATRFSKSTELWTLAESLGGVKSLTCHPPTMTHASVEPEVRREAGIGDGLIRLSVGLEDVEDLLADLDQALAQVASKATVRT